MKYFQTFIIFDAKSKYICKCIKTTYFNGKIKYVLFNSKWGHTFDDKKEVELFLPKNVTVKETTCIEDRTANNLYAGGF